MPNYARQPFSPQPKGAPHRLVKQDAEADVDKQDRLEREKCHTRSGGRCEVLEVITPLFIFDAKTMAQKPVTQVAVRCKRRVGENHHLIGGIGRRNKGKSILAEHRLDTCLRCHSDITGKVLVPAVNAQDRQLAAKVVYERKKLPKKDKGHADGDRRSSATVST